MENGTLTLSVCLTDTSGKEDVHINDVLVQENHATYSHSVRINCRRSLVLKERSSILALWVWKKLLIRFR